jgi:signal transduction histidine kinase
VLLLRRVNYRVATVIRLIGLGLLSWSVFTDAHHPGTGGRGVVVAVSYGLCAISWLLWTWRPTIEDGATVEIYVLAVAGGILCGAAAGSAASAFVFVAVVAAGMREPLGRAMIVTAGGILAIGVTVLIYDGSALGLLAYSLGLAAATLGASNARQSVMRADQAELLLAQTQRSHEEQLRTARLEESTRIAREIHDVLAHSLAGLTIQLEATGALIENGADRDQILARVKQAHQLAREGLSETRRAVGALRGEATPAPPAPAGAGIQALVAEYRSASHASVTISIDGDGGHLTGELGPTLLRVVQESLTNVTKHAPGAAVTIALDAGAGAADPTELSVHNGPSPDAPDASGLSGSGGGYGLQGMRERAEALGGTLQAGPTEDGGWRVRLRIPAREPSGPDATAAVLAR